MRLLVTADLHFNHNRSRGLAQQAIEEINSTPADVLLVVGDTATADERQLEAAISQIHFDGPKLFLCGNHELWTRRDDSHDLFTNELPARIRALGWHWLEDVPFVDGDVAIVGSVGWYDYSYAPVGLPVPRRFYEAKVSPGAASHLSAYKHLLGEDVTPDALEIVARWNDGKMVKLGRSDAVFLDERLASLRRSLDRVPAQCRIVAGVHHVPFEELLPPRNSPTWDFARAYLGSSRMGDLLLGDPRITHVFCGHSHYEAESQIGQIRAINIGSGYRLKKQWVGEV
jgi:3',5'-cyclic AMP phosphodiesterase CpdA